MCLQFGFLIFWRKDFGTKAAHKMLVKLTLGGMKSIGEHSSLLRYGDNYAYIEQVASNKSSLLLKTQK